MKSKNKAKLITALTCALLLVLFADTVALWPWTLTWILAAFAIPGAFKFAKVLYIWLLLDDPDPEADFHFKKPKIKWPWVKVNHSYEFYANGGRDNAV